MQAQSWQLANDLHNCIQTVQTPESSCRPLPRFRGFGGPTSSNAIGIETSTFRLQEVPEIAQDRAISTLSTRNRDKRIQQIRDSANAEDWRRRAWARLEAEQRQYGEEQRRRAEELERLSGLVAKYRRYEEKSQQTRDEVEDILRTQTDKVADIPSGRKWLVLGYRRSRATSAPRVVLRCCKDDEETACVCGQRRGSKGCSMGAPTSSRRTRTNSGGQPSGFLPLAMARGWRSR